MIVPPISLPSVSSESLLYFPANVCGLEIGELFIPETTVAIVNVPEFNVPDFADCPFYVVLPPPIYYASSPYPVYQWDSFELSNYFLSGSLIENNPNKVAHSTDSFVLGSTMLSGTIRNHTYYQKTSLDEITLSSTLFLGNLKDAFKPVFNEAISLNTTLVANEMHIYRYLNTEIFKENLTINATFISGNTHYYRYLSADVNTEGCKLFLTLISGNLI